MTKKVVLLISGDKYTAAVGGGETLAGKEPETCKQPSIMTRLDALTVIPV